MTKNTVKTVISWNIIFVVFFNMKFIHVIAKLNYKADFFSIQCHMIFQKWFIYLK